MASYKQKLERAQRSEHLLLELLAVLHGDGGQHTAAVGIEQSAADAFEVVAAYKAAATEGRDATEM